jgi:hypothetical protein
MTPPQKGDAVFESGALLVKPPTFHAQNRGKRLFLIAKWDTNTVDFSKTTFLQ